MNQISNLQHFSFNFAKLTSGSIVQYKFSEQERERVRYREGNETLLGVFLGLFMTCWPFDAFESRNESRLFPRKLQWGLLWCWLVLCLALSLSIMRSNIEVVCRSCCIGISLLVSVYSVISVAKLDCYQAYDMLIIYIFLYYIRYHISYFTFLLPCMILHR